MKSEIKLIHWNKIVLLIEHSTIIWAWLEPIWRLSYNLFNLALLKNLEWKLSIVKIL